MWPLQHCTGRIHVLKMLFPVVIFAAASAQDGAQIELTGISPKIKFGPPEAPVCEILLTGNSLNSTCELNTPTSGVDSMALINNLTAIVARQQQVLMLQQAELTAIKNFVGIHNPPTSPVPSPPPPILTSCTGPVCTCHKILLPQRTDEYSYYACGTGSDATTRPLFNSYYRGASHEAGDFVVNYGGVDSSWALTTCTGVSGWTWDSGLTAANNCLQLAGCSVTNVAALPVQTSGCA